jgi:hypothetical protein
MMIEVDRFGGFRLEPGFVAGYERRPVHWGYGALSWVTFQRTYSRDGEAWWQTCRRVIEGMMTVQRVHSLEPTDGTRRSKPSFAGRYKSVWALQVVARPATRPSVCPG